LVSQREAKAEGDSKSLKQSRKQKRSLSDSRKQKRKQ